MRARTYFASGPWSDTVRATTNPLQGTNNPSVTLDLDGVTRVKVGDRLYKRLKVTGMNNLHAGAFSSDRHHDVEFRVLGGISDSYEYEDLTHGYGEGAFYAGALTIGEDGEVYHNFGYEVIATGPVDVIGEGTDRKEVPEYGPLYLWLEHTTDVDIGSTANSRATALCVGIADSSDTVPSGRECPSSTPDGSAGHAVQRIRARFNDVPRSHDGESEFTFRLAFVKAMGISPTSLREGALAATGGAVTRVQRVDDRSDLFEITAEPDSDEDVTITLSSSGDCGESGAICTLEEDPKKLYNSPTATVAGPILTASFEGLPSQHDGEAAFSFRIAFSHEIATDEEEFRDHSVEVWGGEVTRAEPVGQRRDLWEVEVEPASEDSVMVSLRPARSCAATGAVCTAGGRLLSVIPSTMVPGPAMWPVRVTGEAQVGKTLTADSSSLSERYGVQVTSMTYRWLANGARVPGANARTYKPDDDKQGQRISVMATYTDDRGNEDTVISAPTEPLAARDRIRRATGLSLISGRALVGHTLTADKSLIIDANGLENAVFHYFWEADDESIPGATGTTYTPVAADVGKVITVIVAYVDDSGRGQSMTSPATLPAMTEEAAAAAEFRNSLRVAANADGSLTLYWNAPDDEVTGYRILRRRRSLGERDLLVYVADTGSAATTYTDTGVVAGVPHSYRVQAIKSAALGELTQQISIFPVQKATNSPATGAPAISGTAQVGETLTADISGIADADGLENVTKDYLWAAIVSSGKIGSMYAYQWLADGAEIENATGYNNTTYTLTEDDVGKAISVRVTFVDDAGYQETLTSAATDPVAAAPQPNSPATGAPTIGGTAQVGETLTADTSGITDEDGLDDSTFTVQWITEDSVMVASAARSYTPTDGDRGKSVQVRVSFTDDAGNPETRTSAQTATVEARTNSPATGAPTISGTAQVGQTLTAGMTGIFDADGLSGESFTYQWVSSDGTTDTDIQKATDSTYRLVAADQGKSVKVRVTFTDDGGNEETLTSAPTEPVLGDGPPGAPRNLTTTPGDREVTLSWDPPADNGNAPATRYRIEWRIDGKDYSRWSQWGTSRSTTYTTNDQANLANGVKYFFRVSAENGNGPYGPASEEVGATPTSGSAVDLPTPVLSNTETLHHGMVRLDWQDIEGAGWYVVQYYHLEAGEWLDLPAAGVDIALSGSSAVVSGVDGLSWLRVGAASCAGESEWSQIEQLFLDNPSDWEGVPVPEVADGDETEPCPVVLGTPVLSDTETLHHGMVRLDWQDIEGAGWYVVQYYHLEAGEWLDLPAAGVDIALSGSSAVVSNVDGLSWLRVRAMSCAGESEWSQIEQLFLDNPSDWEGVPVPEVADGDEIEPCSEDADTSDNSPATGTPTISGTAQAGETLEADTSGISDADGLSDVQYEYQWLADDSDIAGASGSTYTLTDSEESKVIKVEVSFTDDAGNDESLTSEPTAVVAAAPLPPPDNVRAVAKKSGAVELTWDAPQDATVTGYRIERRPTGGNHSDQGRSAGSPRDHHTLVEDTGSADTGYTDNTADRGVGYEYRVSARNEAGAGEESDWMNAEEATASNSPATGAPTITGTAQVGETLTADTSGIADADGLANATFSYQWLADDSDISGATNTTYTLVTEDEGKAIKVQVSFTDDAGNEETLTSEPTGEVSEDYLLPDLVSDPPTRSGRVSVEVAPDGTELLALRFEGYVTNLGGGPLDLSGNPQLSDPADPTSHDVWQRALTTSGDWVQLTKPPVRYETADTHNHFHLMGVMAYSLWDETGTLQIRPGEKIGFCLVDTEHLTERRSQPSVQRYEQSELENCMRNKPDAQSLRMGVSAGWRDTYHRDMVFQWVDVSDVTPGVYRIGVQADPNDVVVESDETNNGVVLSEMVSSVPGYVAESQVVKARPGETVDIELTFRRYGSPDRRAHRIIAAASNGTLTTEDNFRVTDSSGMEHSAFYSKTVQYTPQADFVGVDTFTFIAFDSRRPDYPISPTAATVTIDMSGLDAIVSISDAPASIATGGSVDLDADVTGARPDVAWSVDGVPGGNALVGIVDTEGVYTAPGTVPPQGSVTIRASSIEAPSAFFEAAIMIAALTETAPRVGVQSGTTANENTPATGAPSISGTAQVEETLTVDTSGIADDDGSDNVSYSYQWIRNDGAADSDIAGATGSTYTLVADDEGKTISVQVSFSDDDGNDESLSSAATDSVSAASTPNSPATGVPTISGTAQVGQTLTADTSGIADADGLANATFSYQWLADDAEIAGATGLTYTLVAADEGKVIKVRVRFADDAGTEETLTSAATEASLGSEDVVAWSAIMTVEMVDHGYGYSSYARKAGSLSPASFNVDGTTYTVNMVETWGWMYIGVDRELPFDFVLELDGVRFASNDASFTSYTYSNIYTWATTGLSWRDGETVAVRLLRALEDETAVNSAATGAPTISGTAQVGETLTANTTGVADADGLSSVQYEYQWLADDSDIAGATNATYTLVTDDEGKAITVRVSFTDDAGHNETLTSAATAAVAGAQPTEPPDKPRKLYATASHDSVTLTWDDPGDNTITGYVILRRIPGVPQGHFDELVANTATAATTYTDDTVAAETRYTYRIKAINGAGTSERSRWVHIDTPEAPVPDKPRGLEATVTHSQVTLTWDDPGDDSITGYVILRRVRENDTGGDFSVLVADTGSAAATYTDDTVAAATTYTYRIKAINGAGTSERSRWYHIDIPEAP